MYTCEHFSILSWRGLTVRLDPPRYFYVYLIHFHEAFKHARHYLGFTCNLEARLQLHKSGRGARLMEVVSLAGIGFEVARLWRVETWEEGRALERKLKRTHGHGPALCPICQGKPVDALVSLRQGHWPLSLHSRIGRRQPTGEPSFLTARYARQRWNERFVTSDPGDIIIRKRR